MRRRKINTNKLMGILFFSLLIVFSICYFLQSDFFNLKEVIVKNNQHLAKEDIEELLSLNKNRNIFSYDLKDMEKRVSSSPYIKDCNIKRKVPNKLIVTVDEKTLIGPIYNGNIYCFIDDNGNFVDEIENEKDKKLLINVDYDVNNKKIKFKKEDDKKCLLQLVKNLESENILKQIKAMDLSEKSTISIKTTKGLTICINKDDKIDKKVNELRQVLIDLQSREYCSGSLDMTYNNYILYNP